MQRHLDFSEGEYYHLYNRGTERRDIFMDDYDRQRFRKLLYVANGDKSFKFRDIQNKSFSKIDRGEPLTAIGAYVLMPNHFHLLVRETTEDGISAFMEKLLTGYASYFNKRHARTGRLFQGTFQAQHAADDTYLKYLSAYIHLNPVKLIQPKWRTDGIRNLPVVKKFLHSYQYSSYSDYINGDREVSDILSRDEFPEYFLTEKEFTNYLDDWLTLNDEYQHT